MINGVVIPCCSTKAEKRKLVAKNNKIQSFYQHIEKTRARDNIRDARIIIALVNRKQSQPYTFESPTTLFVRCTCFYICFQTVQTSYTPS